MSTKSRRSVVDSDGKKTAVILPVKEYEHLLEDLHDLAVVAERREEKPVSLEDMKRRLASGHKEKLDRLGANERSA